MNKDSLYRVSLKSVILDDQGRVLVVKEASPPFWDLPGGGMEHGEKIHEALARELKEEVGLVGNFESKLLAADDPHVLQGRDIHQLRLVYHVIPETLPTEAGADSDEISYVDPREYVGSQYIQERVLLEYLRLLD